MRGQPLEPVPAPNPDTRTPSFEPLLSSQGRGWNDLQLDSYRLAPQPDPTAAPVLDAHALSVLLQGTSTVSAFQNGRALRAQVYPGSMSLTPRGASSAYGWSHACIVAHLQLSPALIHATADPGRADPARAELAPTPIFRDPFIEQLCLALIRELHSGGLLGALYADTLAHALALHLLRHYSSLNSPPIPPDRGLTPRHLRLVCDFIGDHLDTDVGLADLAALTGMSPACFTRQFKRSTGLPPHQYLIHRRVERAKELLSGGGLSVAQVAQLVGFFDQSHLDRHFKYWVGVTPKDYRDCHRKG